MEIYSSELSIESLKITLPKIALGVEANTPQQHAAKRNVARSIAEDPQKALKIRSLKGFDQDKTIARFV